VRRRDLIKTIEKAARRREVTRTVHSEGGRHTIYKLAGKRLPIERHTEIDDLLAEKIFKECEEVLGSRWWR
jgi:hypothetical protein